MMGIDALDGFLPRRCKERHVLIHEMVACLDAVQDLTSQGAPSVHPAPSEQPAATRPVAVAHASG